VWGISRGRVCGEGNRKEVCHNYGSENMDLQKSSAGERECQEEGGANTKGKKSARVT